MDKVIVPVKPKRGVTVIVVVTCWFTGTVAELGLGADTLKSVKVTVVDEVPKFVALAVMVATPAWLDVIVI